MFFINDKKIYPEVLPWYYSINEVSESGKLVPDPIFAEYNKVIKSKQDLEDLKKCE